MKAYVTIIALILFLPYGKVYAQGEPNQPTHLLTLFEDNDFLNATSLATDHAYTMGTKIELFYNCEKRPKNLIDKWMPKAGDSSVNVFSMALMQVAITPDDLTNIYYNPKDYPYSGALFATHSLTSSNPVKKYSLQTTLVAGVMGPASLAFQSQATYHSIFNYEDPAGWGNQYKNDVLLNLNFKVEKQLAGYGNFIELTGGAGVQAGTMTDAASVNVMLRIGLMAPYFKGYISSNSSRGDERNKWQVYAFIRPEQSYYLYNAIYEGGMLSKRPSVLVARIDIVNRLPVIVNSHKEAAAREINNLITNITYGISIVRGRYSLSCNQISGTPYLKGLYKNDYGNVTIGYNW